MRWPNSAPAGVQPYNDDVLAEYEGMLEKIVSLADEHDMTALDMIEEWRGYHFGDEHGDDMDQPEWHGWHDAFEDVIRPHATPELDEDDITFELLELIGAPDDDNFND